MNPSFSITFNEYLQHIAGSSWNLGFPLIMLGGFLLLTLMITYYYASKPPANEEEKLATITRKILCSMYLSGVITLFITVVVVICLLKFSAFFGKEFCQFGVVIGFFLICIITFTAYLQLCIKTKNKEMSLLNVPISNSFMSKKVKHLKVVLRNKLLLFLIVIVPFLMLFISNSKQSLVSIVLDNSGSMHEYLPYGINSLEAVLAQSPHKGTYVFTTLDFTKSREIREATVNQHFNTIVNTKNPNSLPTHTEILSSSRELINTFSQVEGAIGSPIYQGIWQNYLEARNVSNPFSTKKMIIISDGDDDLYQNLKLNPNQIWDKKDIFQQKGEVGQSPYDFFGGGIYCINLGESDNENLFADCAESIQIFDGTTQRSYFNALVDILPEMFYDLILIYFIIGILAITFLGLFISKQTVK